jgi:hypothetical protein
LNIKPGTLNFRARALRGSLLSFHSIAIFLRTRLFHVSAPSEKSG